MAATRYNPPPNWPPPPDSGWEPGPGWRPDPRWGPPPPGWKLYEPTNPFGRGFGLAYATVVTLFFALYFLIDDMEVSSAYCVGSAMFAAPAAAVLGRISSFRWPWWLYVITVVVITPFAGEFVLLQQP
ncbi:hypothetical protein ACI2LF_30460 [Kribbella sp. NPDC020789]